MKKYLYIVFAIFLLVVFTGITLAKSDKSENSEDENSNKPIYVGRQLENTIRNTERLQERLLDTNNEDVEAEVEDIKDEQVDADTEIDNSLNDMKARPSIVKFIMGPDYKNAGQVRSQIVQLRNQIEKLTRLKDKLSTTNVATIDETIASLNSDLYDIELKLSEQLKGFSLLGWLSKLLANFTVVATPTPTGSSVPTVVPSPSASPEASSSPVPTETP
ncbi:hypothetical protein A2422_01655 [Candidatus Woesebacteria bacterium RIFOXYC1_FULL_31_51]|uniref:Uncharacterized protein n=1 Tax=Candidatus Woesebacteria bacterium GW2011_GWC2_31_9 TaxID=1618586 RepID=A0A0G0BL82_9BACT|nr:MAG: hypothetical protein UR17_C0001G0787 [Candidatus Woesebacteria bacterium GW2011_GWF1_31_35]KKP23668.1 MAG: hypothetical protein UR11_C0001G0642 [Candidatus Woesebacteria bacterium GW2011_GWC1_30_29]KKP26951.1 MAG: hypothetical protein UR13_C0001G0046 [Candidatus Woesebacteria bacterium GW2011_GWD1_31_12]KKP27943.1 MAG: hypothetical protein UR16_C0002G0273 [Candidatus Woesebacteria bacterium GW2011_GWB1_31_29]KKP31807.1 MAG: hypothetical protein UR21_C0005G0029 [Candidatus Woesebacteria 